MLRKTSSGRVLRGILILLLAMVASSAISLTATSFLLKQVVELGVLCWSFCSSGDPPLFGADGSGGLGLVFASNREPGAELETAIQQTTGGLHRHVPGQGRRPDGF